MTEERVTQQRRGAALIAIGAALAVIVMLAWLLVDMLALVALALAGQVLLVFGVVRASVVRWPRSAPFLALVGGGLLLIVVALAQTDEAVWLRLAVLFALQAVFIVAGRIALKPVRDTKAGTQPGRFRARRGVLLLNPKSGGGKAEKFQLADKARSV